tara:strand:- start:5824 stop:6585 length:762 start_codon:yes stop_codon:yes gene_type:complete
MSSRLTAAISRHEALTIAVSGGVDSMTLAHVAHSVLGQRVRMVHAISPAVPPLATARVRDHGAKQGWRLDLVDAGEFDDPRYRANPVNRCFFCKSNLYAAIAGLTKCTIASGTNSDDLGDFRPGLEAAQQWQVVHPYIEAGLDKAAIYALAKHLRLSDLAKLPAQPCLASRVETGIAVNPGDLAFVDHMETLLRADLGQSATVRCRITHAGVIVETEGEAPPASIAAACRETGRDYLGHRPYRRGAAFLRVDK